MSWQVCKTKISEVVLKTLIPFLLNRHSQNTHCLPVTEHKEYKSELVTGRLASQTAMQKMFSIKAWERRESDNFFPKPITVSILLLSSIKTYFLIFLPADMEINNKYLLIPFYIAKQFSLIKKFSGFLNSCSHAPFLCAFPITPFKTFMQVYLH